MNDFMPRELPMAATDENGFSETKNPSLNIPGNETNVKGAENNDDVIRRILGNYDIGPKLRQLRLRKKIALVDLGKHTGLSASMLSQLENGKLIPTLPTLARIAMVFDVGIEFFFGDKRAKRVFSIVRAGERIRFPELSQSPVPGYFFEVLAYGATDKNMSAYLAEFPKLNGEQARAHFHDGSEFVHVFSGTLAINYQSELHVLREGDSVYFDASESHSYHGESDPPTKAIIIITPPRL